MTRVYMLLRILFIIFILSLCSCGESNPIDVPQPYLTVESGLRPFSASGGEGELRFSTDEAWRIETETGDMPGGWFGIDPVQGGAGEHIAVTVRVDENPAYVGRSFTLTVRTASLERSVEVSQLKRNVIIAGENHRELSAEGQTLTIEIQSNVEYEVEIAEGGEWIEAAEGSRAEPGLTAAEHRFAVAANTDPQPRTARILFKGFASDLQDEVTVVQAAWIDPDPERSALAAIYREAGGEGWTHSDNWCSDRPTGEWYGVRTDDEGHVVELRLPQNNLRGKLSDKLACLTHLRHIDMSRNELCGALCIRHRDNDLLSPLTGLETADFSHNNLEGDLAIAWHKLERLTRLDVSSNDIEGGIPMQWEPMLANGRHVDLILYNNRLYSDIPEFMQFHDQWNRIALQILRQRPLLDNGQLCASGLGYKMRIVMPDVVFTLADDTQQEMRSIYSNNELTMLLHWDPLQQRSTDFIERVVRRFHVLFGDMGFGVVGLIPDKEESRRAALEYMQQHDVAWTVAVDCRDEQGRRPILLDEPYPSYLLIDSQGRLRLQMADGIYADCVRFDGFEVDMTAFSHTDFLNRDFKERFGSSTYESTDYSRDKQYETIQRASMGKGIDIVLLGEAFTDIDIESGIYRELMLSAAEAMFSIEPMRSYRQYFNVHIVYAVSRKPYIGTDRTQVALGTVKNTVTQVYNDRKTIAEYAFAPCSDITGFPIPCVIINDNMAAVTMLNIYQQYPNYAFIGYNYGSRISKDIVIHETVGHALGLLGDEYWSPAMEDIPSSSAAELRLAQSNGCYLNLSLTKDQSSVTWQHLIEHPNYWYVGIYEGGYGYFNVWRSEKRSIMGGEADVWYFNAISRELLVKRILTLAGETYTFERFLANDSDHGRPAAKELRHDDVRSDTRNRHVPPIFDN